MQGGAGSAQGEGAPRGVGEAGTPTATYGLLAALGLSSGLPLLLTQSTLSLWLTEAHVSLAAVGWATMVTLPYSLKFLWSPALDSLQPPLLGRLGRRRGWMVWSQCGVALALGAMAWAGQDVAANLGWVVAAAAACALMSASQDVVVDAYRVERLPPEAQGFGAAISVLGYRIGMLIAGAGALYLAEFWEQWPAVYGAMALMALGCVCVTLLGEEPATDPAQVRAEASSPEQGWVARMRAALWEPLRGLLTRPDWWMILLFIMSFKLGDALANRMLMPFLKGLGFGKLDLANIAKTYGIMASIGGALLGGLLVRHLGTLRALWIGGFLQAASNLVFIWQAHVGAHPWALVVTISVENLSGGLGTAAFVAYLSGLCDRRYTATQYALLTAASSVILTVMGGASGVLAQSLGWSLYFMTTALLALPGLLLLAWLTRRPVEQMT
jgi:MFS transporter, PAT family, beta-lactamase induction signal transducer AmpG